MKIQYTRTLLIVGMDDIGFAPLFVGNRIGEGFSAFYGEYYKRIETPVVAPLLEQIKRK